MNGSKPKLRVIRGGRGNTESAQQRRVADAIIDIGNAMSTDLARGHWGRVEQSVRERRFLLAHLTRSWRKGLAQQRLAALTAMVSESERTMVTLLSSARRSDNPPR